MPRQLWERLRRYGNINPLSIAYATRLGLGPTNPGTIIVAQETLLFRRPGFSPGLWLLIPAFSLPRAPPTLPVWLHCSEERSATTRSSLTLGAFLIYQYHLSFPVLENEKWKMRNAASNVGEKQVRVFGTILEPRYIFRAESQLTSELLRTL